jgi:hypothetical protein
MARSGIRETLEPLRPGNYFFEKQSAIPKEQWGFAIKGNFTPEGT